MLFRSQPEYESRSLAKTVVDLAATRIGGILAFLGIGLLYCSHLAEGAKGAGPGDTTLREVGALLFVTGALNVFWDLRGRRALIDEMMSAAGLSSDIASAGLTRLTTHYLSIDFDNLLNGANRVDLFFAYAQTWRATHASALRRLVAREGTKLRVVLPNPANDGLMVLLAAKFHSSTDEIVEKIRGAESDLANLGRQAATQNAVELRYTEEFPVFTYYRFDDRCVGVLYSQADGRVDVPAFECNHGGTLHQFFSGQFRSLWESSSVREFAENMKP
jgi:hypothetical protein